MRKILIIILALALMSIMLFACATEEPPPPVAEETPPVEEVQEPETPEPTPEEEPEIEDEPEHISLINEEAEPLFPAYLEIFHSRDYNSHTSFVENEAYEEALPEMSELSAEEVITLIQQLVTWNEPNAISNHAFIAGEVGMALVMVRDIGEPDMHYVWFDDMVFVGWFYEDLSGLIFQIEQSEVERMGMQIENAGGSHPDSVYELLSIITLEHDGMAIQIEEYNVISARVDEPYILRAVFVDGELQGWVQRTITVRLHDLTPGAHMATIEEFIFGMQHSDYYADTAEWESPVYY